jgi:hypothetical protein
MTTDDRAEWRSMAKLTTVGDPNAARLLSAHLEAEGIETHVRGEALGPYPIGVGSWGATEIWVAESDLVEARAIVEEIEAAAADTEVDQAGIGPSPSLGVSVLWWLVAVALLAMIAYSWINRFT